MCHVDVKASSASESKSDSSDPCREKFEFKVTFWLVVYISIHVDNECLVQIHHLRTHVILLFRQFIGFGNKLIPFIKKI